ncbi:hypothetical protein ILUMI_24314 [Ignelater luminosus]|uniref:Uncharacterized protein n=1 Tax=Ignelater luminosus TaxID=2038154 RepID=A0A8K0G140_IGNLU|nr:hypothetical protein ILUMI_24314 [Ignelater luminosus]
MSIIFKTPEAYVHCFSEEIEADILALSPEVDEQTERFDGDLTEMPVKSVQQSLLLSFREIEAQVGVSLWAVQYTLKRFEFTGSNNDRLYPGKPLVITEAEDKYIYRSNEQEG